MKVFLIILCLGVGLGTRVPFSSPKDIFVLYELTRLAYTVMDGRSIVFYDDNFPLSGLHDVVSRCHDHPEYGFACELKTSAEKQTDLGELWTAFFNNCTLLRGDASAASFKFVDTKDITPEDLNRHLTPSMCVFSHPPVPHFNVRTSITVTPL
jgi:hypothetical protein